MERSLLRSIDLVALTEVRGGEHPRCRSLTLSVGKNYKRARQEVKTGYPSTATDAALRAEVELGIDLGCWKLRGDALKQGIEAVDGPGAYERR